MDKIMKVFKNKWFILFVSIMNGAYTLCLCYFAYAVLFYKIVLTDTVRFAIIYSLLSVLVGLLKFYTRKSALTSLFSVLDMFAYLPVLLLAWGNWALIVPAAIVTLFGFFVCGMNDTAKTVFGTVFLLMYILGCIAFFLIMNVFRVTTIDTVIASGVSPSGTFRYYVLDVQNKSSGKTAVYVEPNQLDIPFGNFIRFDTTIKKLVNQANNPTTVECNWNDDKLFINGEEWFDEADYVTYEDDKPVYDFLDDTWTHTYFSADYPLMDAFHKIYSAISKKIGGSKSSDDTPAVTTAPSDDEAAETTKKSSDTTANEEETVSKEGRRLLPIASWQSVFAQ